MATETKEKKGITILDVFENRWRVAGKKPILDGYSLENFKEMQLRALGECWQCHTELAAHNAYPDENTETWECRWACHECIAYPFSSVDDFEQSCIALENEKEAFRIYQRELMLEREEFEDDNSEQ